MLLTGVKNTVLLVDRSMLKSIQLGLLCLQAVHLRTHPCNLLTCSKTSGSEPLELASVTDKGICSRSFEPYFVVNETPLLAELCLLGIVYLLL